MKFLMITVTTLVLVSAPASAVNMYTWRCPVVDAPRDRDPIVMTMISINFRRPWMTVTHIMHDRATFTRHEQYRNYKVKATDDGLQWSGVRNRNSDVTMMGQFTLRQEGDQPLATYRETQRENGRVKHVGVWTCVPEQME